MSIVWGLGDKFVDLPPASPVIGEAASVDAAPTVGDPARVDGPPAVYDPAIF